MRDHWPSIVAGMLTALVCFMVSIAEPPAVLAQRAAKVAPQQSQIQFIVVPTPPTEQELRDVRIRERLAMQQQGEQ